MEAAGSAVTESKERHTGQRAGSSALASCSSLSVQVRQRRCVQARRTASALSCEKQMQHSSASLLPKVAIEAERHDVLEVSRGQEHT